MIFDSKLNWAAHMDKVKQSCQRPLNVLKTISSGKKGADQKALMMLYRALVRSKMDYGSIVYNSASSRTLESLNVIANQALRIATGVFKTTLTKTLHTLANEMSLQIRRNMLSIKYYFKTRSQLNSPSYNYIVYTSQALLYKTKD